jgi:hypothetical protein
VSSSRLESLERGLGPTGDGNVLDKKSNKSQDDELYVRTLADVVFDSSDED